MVSTTWLRHRVYSNYHWKVENFFKNAIFWRMCIWNELKKKSHRPTLVGCMSKTPIIVVLLSSWELEFWCGPSIVTIPCGNDFIRAVLCYPCALILSLLFSSFFFLLFSLMLVMYILWAFRWFTRYLSIWYAVFVSSLFRVVSYTQSVVRVSFWQVE